MAIGYINVAHISRAAGRSAVGTAAYAARVRLVDVRTGRIYDYSRGQADVLFSGIFLPKGAPEQFRDRAALWNLAEQAETKKNARTARRLIIALPHELTPKQQQQLLTDFIRENLTRKGLAVDASIHGPDPEGDQRNDHAHLLITTRFMDAKGLTDKDRESNEKAALERWNANWEKMVNRQLERYGHAPMRKTPEGEIAQIHLGQKASALERKGVKTQAGDQLRQIVNNNDRQRAAANDPRRPAGKQQDYTAGKSFAREVTTPDAIDRDRQNAEWREKINAAGIARAEERRRQFLQSQANERQTFERHGEEMAARHAEAWTELLHHHSAAPASYQPGTLAEVEEAASTGASFVLGLFASWAEGLTGGKRPAKRRRDPDRQEKQKKERQAEQQRESRSQEIEALHAEQAHERAAYERRRAAMLLEQNRALAMFEQAESVKSPLQNAFDLQAQTTERKGAEQDRNRGGPELEL